MKCRVIYLAIGDELLVGQTVNTNAAFIGARLNEYGIELVHQLVVRDTAEAIREGLEWSRERANVIIMTGGLGPTKDDITKTTLANWFNRGLVSDEAQLNRIREFFEKRGRSLLEVNLRQSDVVEGCDVIPNFSGTSPGMWIKKDGCIYVSIPGVPYEMHAMMKEFVLPRLQKIHGGDAIVHHTLLTHGIGESFLADKIREIESKIHAAGFGLAYLPSPGMVKLRVPL